MHVIHPVDTYGKNEGRNLTYPFFAFELFFVHSTHTLLLCFVRQYRAVRLSRV